MNIRPATGDDAAAIAAIHVETWRVAYRGIMPDDFLQSLSVEQREASWRASLQDGNSDVWIAETAGRMLGWISMGRSRDADAVATTAEIWAIYVAPGSWRHGVGRALWNVGKTQFESAGFDSVTLWVLRENEKAMKFYRALGFTEDPGKTKIFERSGRKLVEIRLRAALRIAPGRE